MSTCLRHGLGHHVCVHEAGHAVAAIDHDVAFRAVVLYDYASAPRYLDSRVYAPAALEMLAEDPSSWVKSNVLGSLRFVMGGFAAEQAVLGHAIARGFDEDMNMWRKGVGRTSAQTLNELSEFVGRPFGEVVAETQKWARDNDRSSI